MLQGVIGEKELELYSHGFHELVAANDQLERTEMYRSLADDLSIVLSWPHMGDL